VASASARSSAEPPWYGDGPTLTVKLLAKALGDYASARCVESAPCAVAARSASADASGEGEALLLSACRDSLPTTSFNLSDQTQTFHDRPTTWYGIDEICNLAAPGSARHALASRL
jgi:hypothetical protein